MNTTIPPRQAHLAPRTGLGRWTVALAAAAVAATAASVVAFATGLVEPADSFTDKPLLTVWGIIIVVSSTASVVTGALAMLRRQDWATLVIAATVAGVLVAVLGWQQVFEGMNWLEG